MPLPGTAGKELKIGYALLRNGLSTAGGIPYFRHKPSVSTRLNSLARLQPLLLGHLMVAFEDVVNDASESLLPSLSKS